jgi:hypothetical protein
MALGTGCYGAVGDVEGANRLVVPCR